MAIHVQDDEADWLLRDFARKRGVGITAAIKLAVREASAHEARSVEELERRLEPIIEEIRAAGGASLSSQQVKFLTDDLWGEGD